MDQALRSGVQRRARLGQSAIRTPCDGCNWQQKPHAALRCCIARCRRAHAFTAVLRLACSGRHGPAGAHRQSRGGRPATVNSGTEMTASQTPSPTVCGSRRHSVHLRFRSGRTRWRSRARVSSGSPFTCRPAVRFCATALPCRVVRPLPSSTSSATQDRARLREAVQAAACARGCRSRALALVPGLHAWRAMRRDASCSGGGAARGALHARVSLEPPDGVLLGCVAACGFWRAGSYACAAADSWMPWASVRCAITPSPLARCGCAHGSARRAPVFVAVTNWLRGWRRCRSVARAGPNAASNARHHGRAHRGRCLRLPRDGFARRFGRSCLPRSPRTGRVQEPRAAYAASERFVARRDSNRIADTAHGSALEPLSKNCAVPARTWPCVQAIEVQLRHRTARSRVWVAFRAAGRRAAAAHDRAAARASRRSCCRSPCATCAC
jgi:hypothetical protein